MHKAQKQLQYTHLLFEKQNYQTEFEKWDRAVEAKMVIYCPAQSILQEWQWK